jgi:tripartite-type tricarboxylate transporter receptor subunit TctC
MPAPEIPTKLVAAASYLSILTIGAALLGGAAVIDNARADDFPSRPITVVVPFAPGGSSDIVMRLIAQKASESIRQPIVIENRPGAAGNVAALAIKNAPPDGYLLMMGHTGTHAINPSLYRDLKFDPIKDFQPITALIAFNNILVVPQASPARSVNELVALARSRPDGLSYGSQGIGTGGHLLGEMLARQSGAKFVHVPYRGVAPAVTDTVAGRMDLLFSSYISAAGHIESGRLRMLAIAGSERHPRIPQVPTMAEAGYPDVQMQQWFGLFAPAGTPAPVVGKLNAEFVKALHNDEVRNTLVQQLATIIGGTPEDFAALVARDIVRLGKVVKDSGATVQE